MVIANFILTDSECVMSRACANTPHQLNELIKALPRYIEFVDMDDVLGVSHGVGPCALITRAERQDSPLQLRYLPAQVNDLSQDWIVEAGAFPVVARLACGDEIVVIILAAVSHRDNVIDVQRYRRRALPTVLADKAVTLEDVKATLLG